MGYQISVTLNDHGIINRVRSGDRVISQAIEKALGKASLMVIQRAKEAAPRAQGTLSGSINASPVKKSGGDYLSTVGTNVEYAPHQEYGTGIYGKHGRPIVPKRKKVLAWKNGGKWIVARQVKGVRPKKFMQKGLEFLQSRQSSITKELADDIRSGLTT